MIFLSKKSFLCCTTLFIVFLFSCVSIAYAKTQGTVTATVRLRTTTNTESKALQTIPNGEEVEILSSDGKWYRIHYGNFKGYVLKEYVKIADKSAQIKALGSAPGIMRVGDETSDVIKLQKALDLLGYYDGKVDGKYGDGTKKAVEEYQEYHKLEVDGSAGYATVSSIFGSCNNKTLTTQAKPGEVDEKNNKENVTTKTNTVSSIASIGSAPSSSREGDRGNDVVKLQQALEVLGYYHGVIDGKYGEGTVAAVKRLQRKRGMTEDGIAGNSTIRVLFGNNASSNSSNSNSSNSSTKYKTEKLDWFADHVSRIIPKNARFTVKDVKTGKTFTAVRWSGGNHLDAEPRTSSDSQTLKAISGGQFEWTRRAILILYKGHVYAASMNTMPHGEDTISGNNYEGHFCIHFENSKTHGSNKVDADHQKAVDKAADANW